MDAERIVAAAMRGMNSLYVLLALSLCVLVGFLPLELLLALTHDGRAYPAFLALAVLCSPALAAGFAVCRDHPLLRGRARGSADCARASWTADWFASPYVDDDDETGVFRPFLRAWTRTRRRAWRVSAVYAAFAALVVCDAMWCAHTSFGALMMPPSLVALVASVPAYAVSLALVVECPHATTLAVLRNGVLLSVRRGAASVPTLCALAAYVRATIRMPGLAAPLGTGLVLFVVWADARWQTRPLLRRLREEDRRRTSR